MDTHKPFKRVGTHHGRFHADEVMATAVLKRVFEIDVTRTRDREKLDSLDMVYDVGEVEFDHHQAEKAYREGGIPYAACGLIWRRFGMDAVRLYDPLLKEEEAASIFGYVDAVLIKGIDAVDNGIKTGDRSIRIMDISSIISGFNPPWYADGNGDREFYEAVDFASAVLENTIRQKHSAIKAGEIVAEAFAARQVPEIMVLDRACPWFSALHGLDKKQEVLFVILPDGDGYVIRTVDKRDGRPKARKNLPKSWAGKRSDELGKIVGIDDAVFCHTGRFVAGAKSFESITLMAGLALAEPPEGRLQRLLWRFKKVFTGGSAKSHWKG
jgi:uncharacterized UPF0160 family protein